MSLVSPHGVFPVGYMTHIHTQDALQGVIVGNVPISLFYSARSEIQMDSNGIQEYIIFNATTPVKKLEIHVM